MKTAEKMLTIGRKLFTIGREVFQNRQKDYSESAERLLEIGREIIVFGNHNASLATREPNRLRKPENTDRSARNLPSARSPACLLPPTYPSTVIF
jgi:hypothetical protein